MVPCIAAFKAILTCLQELIHESTLPPLDVQASRCVEVLAHASVREPSTDASKRLTPKQPARANARAGVVPVRRGEHKIHKRHPMRQRVRGWDVVEALGCLHEPYVRVGHVGKRATQEIFAGEHIAVEASNKFTCGDFERVVQVTSLSVVGNSVNLGGGRGR